MAIFQRAWKERLPLTIRGGGAMERDYMYVGNVCDAVLAALGSELQGVYNIGRVWRRASRTSSPS